MQTNLIVTITRFKSRMVCKTQNGKVITTGCKQVGRSRGRMLHQARDMQPRIGDLVMDVQFWCIRPTSNLETATAQQGLGSS